MALKYIDDIDLDTVVKGKKVIARFDFNVPLSDGQISDTTRVDEALETIKYILSGSPKKLILMSHLGRPKGERNLKYSLDPVAAYLADKLGEDVILTESCLDTGIKTLLGLNEGRILLLENLRFHPEEEAGDHQFAKILASYADIYVNDAFGTAHRKHASTYEIVRFFKNRAYGGLLMKKEIKALDVVTAHPQSPFVAIMGGAKVSDKIKIINRLLTTVDKLLIGGAMAYPFLKARGHEVGKSLCGSEDVTLAKKILNAKEAKKIVLPIDHIASTGPDGDATTVNEVNIPENLMALDIGPATLEAYASNLLGAKTILWNGPMGFFEKPAFAAGSLGIAKILAQSNAYTLVGGGDSVAAVNQSGLASKMSHVSTGGGASLEYIENGTLPGIQALKFGLD